MKLSTFIQAVLLMLAIAFAASCGSSRSTTHYPDRRGYPGDPYPNERNYPPGHQKKVYGDKSARVYAPGQRKKYGSRYFPLIITRRPGMNILRTRDGRYYYKNPDGFYYWQGYDNRLYLDERHLSRVEYDRYDYDDWKARGRNNVYRNRGR
jgi:hypothetical protein